MNNNKETETKPRVPYIHDNEFFITIINTIETSKRVAISLNILSWLDVKLMTFR